MNIETMAAYYLISIFLIIFIGFSSFIFYKLIIKYYKLKRIYHSWNIGDELHKTLTLSKLAPWNEPIVSNAKVYRKQDKWVQLEIDYPIGTKDYEFTIKNFKEITSWRKND